MKKSRYSNIVRIVAFFIVFFFIGRFFYVVSRKRFDSTAKNASIDIGARGNISIQLNDSTSTAVDGITFSEISYSNETIPVAFSDDSSMESSEATENNIEYIVDISGDSFPFGNITEPTVALESSDNLNESNGLQSLNLIVEPLYAEIDFPVNPSGGFLSVAEEQVVHSQSELANGHFSDKLLATETSSSDAKACESIESNLVKSQEDAVTRLESNNATEAAEMIKQRESSNQTINLQASETLRRSDEYMDDVQDTQCDKDIDMPHQGAISKIDDSTLTESMKVIENNQIADNKISEHEILIETENTETISVSYESDEEMVEVVEPEIIHINITESIDISSESVHVIETVEDVFLESNDAEGAQSEQFLASHKDEIIGVDIDNISVTSVDENDIQSEAQVEMSKEVEIAESVDVDVDVDVSVDVKNTPCDTRDDISDVKEIISPELTSVLDESIQTHDVQSDAIVDADVSDPVIVEPIDSQDTRSDSQMDDNVDISDAVEISDPVIVEPFDSQDTQSDSEAVIDVDVDVSDVVEISDAVIVEPIDSQDTQSDSEAVIDVNVDVSDVVEISDAVIVEPIDSQDTQSDSQMDDNVDVSDVVEISDVVIVEPIDSQDTQSDSQMHDNVDVDISDVVEISDAVIVEPIDSQDTQSDSEAVIDVNADVSDVVEISDAVITEPIDSQDTQSDSEAVIDVNADVSDVVEISDVVIVEPIDSQDTQSDSQMHNNVDVDISDVVEISDPVITEPIDSQDTQSDSQMHNNVDVDISDVVEISDAVIVEPIDSQDTQSDSEAVIDVDVDVSDVVEISDAVIVEPIDSQDTQSDSHRSVDSVNEMDNQHEQSLDRHLETEIVEAVIDISANFTTDNGEEIDSVMPNDVQLDLEETTRIMDISKEPTDFDNIPSELSNTDEIVSVSNTILKSDDAAFIDVQSQTDNFNPNESLMKEAMLISGDSKDEFLLDIVDVSAQKMDVQSVLTSSQRFRDHTSILTQENNPIPEIDANEYIADKLNSHAEPTRATEPLVESLDGLQLPNSLVKQDKPKLPDVVNISISLELDGGAKEYHIVFDIRSHTLDEVAFEFCRKMKSEINAEVNVCVKQVGEYLKTVLDRQGYSISKNLFGISQAIPIFDSFSSRSEAIQICENQWNFIQHIIKERNLPVVNRRNCPDFVEDMFLNKIH